VTCLDCADYVIYTSAATQDWVAPVRDSLTAQGFSAAVFSGPASLGAARDALAFIRDTNRAWNAACLANPPCDRLYPESPGPTLVIVGDAWPVVVSVMPFANPEQCLGSCSSYLLAADLDSDSIPDCPVEVVPGNTFEEVQSAVAAACDVSRGRYVDPGRRVVLVGGDRDAGGESPWVSAFLSETEQLYAGAGLGQGEVILESSYPVGDDYAGIQTATRDAINAGVAEAWFFGLRTDELKFPAWSVSTISDPANLTRMQRVLVWAPGCRMGAVQSYDPWNFGQAPTVEKLAFNPLSKTVLAGGIFHLDAGYGSQHRTWAAIVRDARVNATPGTPLSRIHYDAVRAWYDQFPGDHYVLSSVALGCRATVPDAVTAVPTAEPDALGERNEQPLRALGNVGAKPVFRFSLAEPVQARLDVLDASGRLVCTVREGVLASGSHQYTWFGRNKAGRSVAAGVYFGVLSTARGRQETAKVHIVR
jgi:hypothetical protein